MACALSGVASSPCCSFLLPECELTRQPKSPLLLPRHTRPRPRQLRGIFLAWQRFGPVASEARCLRTWKLSKPDASEKLPHCTLREPNLSSHPVTDQPAGNRITHSPDSEAERERELFEHPVLGNPPPRTNHLPLKPALPGVLMPAVAALLVASSLLWCSPGGDTLAAPAGGRIGGSTFSPPPSKSSQGMPNKKAPAKAYSAPPVSKPPPPKTPAPSNRIGGSAFPSKAKAGGGKSSVQPRPSQAKGLVRTQGRVGGSLFPSSSQASPPTSLERPQTEKAAPQAGALRSPAAIPPSVQSSTVIPPLAPPIRGAVPPPQAATRGYREPVDTVRRRVMVRPRIYVQPGPSTTGSIQNRRFIAPPPNILVVPPRPQIVVPSPFLFPFIGPPVFIPPLIIPPPILIPPPYIPPPVLPPPVAPAPPQVIIPPQVVVPPPAVIPPPVVIPPLAPPPPAPPLPPSESPSPSLVVPVPLEPPPPVVELTQPGVIQPPPPVEIQPPPAVAIQPALAPAAADATVIAPAPSPSVVIQSPVIVQQGGDDVLIKTEIALEVMILSVLLLLLVRTYTGNKRPL